jgi:arginyl-tRNA synthetase
LFRSTRFADDQDRPIRKSDGSWTYFGADLAYHYQKAQGADALVDIWGADHAGTVKRIKAAVAAMTGEGGEPIPFEVKLVQMVQLLRGGEPVKMSKRSGDLVTLADVVDEVGADATRFMLLYRRNDATLDFDFVVVKEQSRDNPVFYVQYAHARCCSVFRNAAKDMPELDISESALAGADLSLLSGEADLDLVKVLAQWPRIVSAAALAHEPHRIAFYLYEVASAFHAFWAKGREDQGLRFVNSEAPKLTTARLALVGDVRQVLANGLAILGVSAPEELS